MADTRYMTHDKWSSLTATQVTYPSGRQVASTCDALYRRTGVNETSGGASIAAWEFFGYRTATSVLGNGITCSYMNNAQTNSAVQAAVPNPSWGDKSTDRLGYDGSGRLIAKRFLPTASTTSLVGFTTAYDPSSNKLFERALHAESRSALYSGYDSMDRLREYQRGVLTSGGGSIATPITRPGTDKQRSYDLDGLGNWKNTVVTLEGASSATTEIRQHNKLNEITQFASTPVLYDHGDNAANPNPLITQRGNGNIVDDGTRLYAYDALNRLTTVKRKSDNAQVAGYTYDALGRRVLKVVTNGGVSGTIANATYRYIYDEQQIVEELLSAGGSYSTLRQFVWGHYIDELIQLKVPTTTATPPLTAGTYYPLQDTLYRTTALTDASGVITGAYDFDAYGNTLMFSAAGTGGDWWADDAITTLQPPCEFLFTGRQYDPETEIYWYRFRFFDPLLGRWLQRDLPYVDGMNLYQFVRGMPVAVSDPFGKCPEGYTDWTSEQLSDAGKRYVPGSTTKKQNLLNQYPYPGRDDAIVGNTEGSAIPMRCKPKCRVISYCVKIYPELYEVALLTTTPAGPWKLQAGGAKDPISSYLGSNAGVSTWQRPLTKTYSVAQEADIMAKYVCQKPIHVFPGYQTMTYFDYQYLGTIRILVPGATVSVGGTEVGLGTSWTDGQGNVWVQPPGGGDPEKEGYSNPTPPRQAPPGPSNVNVPSIVSPR